MLYTKKGDKGTTKFLDTGKGERVSKSSPRSEALGTLDELNSFLGLCRAEAVLLHISVPKGNDDLSAVLYEIQENLFIVQAETAGSKDKSITPAKVKEIEHIIDAIEKELPPLKGFSIPGETKMSALLDVARTLARKTERRVTAVHESGDRKINDHTLAYLNRLSSLLFALARWVNFKLGIAEKNPSYK